MSLQVIDIYTKALFKSALEADIIDRVKRDMEMIAQCVQGSAELTAFLKNPVIPSGKQESVMEKIFKKRLDALTYRFIRLLIKKKRLDLLGGIPEQFGELYRHHFGIAKARIYSVAKIDQEQADQIVNKLKSRLNKDIEADFQIDPDMIGGVRIQEGDNIYDYSIKSQLRRFQSKLMKA